METIERQFVSEPDPYDRRLRQHRSRRPRPDDPNRVLIPNGVDIDDLREGEAAGARPQWTGSASRTSARCTARVTPRPCSPPPSGDHPGGPRPGPGRPRGRRCGELAAEETLPVSFTGFVEHAEAVQEMRRASALIFHQPPEQLGSSGKIFEYLLSGRPYVRRAPRQRRLRAGPGARRGRVRSCSQSVGVESRPRASRREVEERNARRCPTRYLEKLCGVFRETSLPATSQSCSEGVGARRLPSRSRLETNHRLPADDASWHAADDGARRHIVATTAFAAMTASCPIVTSPEPTRPWRISSGGHRSVSMRTARRCGPQSQLVRS